MGLLYSVNCISTSDEFPWRFSLVIGVYPSSVSVLLNGKFHALIFLSNRKLRFLVFIVLCKVFRKRIGCLIFIDEGTHLPEVLVHTDFDFLLCISNIKHLAYFAFCFISHYRLFSIPPHTFTYHQFFIINCSYTAIL